MARYRLYPSPSVGHDALHTTTGQQATSQARSFAPPSVACLFNLALPSRAQRHQLPRLDLRIGLRLLRIYPAPRTNDFGTQHAPLEQRSAAQPAPIAFRRQRLTFQSDRTAWVWRRLAFKPEQCLSALGHKHATRYEAAGEEKLVGLVTATFINGTGPNGYL